MRPHLHHGQHEIRQLASPYHDSMFAHAAELARLTPTSPAGLPQPAGPPTSECDVPGCGMTAGRNYKHYCTGHFDAHLTRAYELADDVGRGTLDV